MKKIVVVLLSLLYVTSACTKTEQKSPVVEEEKYPELHATASVMFGALPTVAESENNPITEAKVELGRSLYFDERLSKDNTISCNSCHKLDSYGVDNLSVSPGNDEGTFGTRNSPTVFNAALHAAQFWDGREPDVEAQAGGPITNPVEMAMPSEEVVVERLSKIERYSKLFSEAYPGEDQPINYENIKKAIGAFERKLITPAPFDDYIEGDLQALTAQEKEGLKTFIDAGCVTCHSGTLLGGSMFQKFGIFENYWYYTGSENIDTGKYEVTAEEADKFIFKVPSLRNVEMTYPYFHDGSVEDLAEATSIMAEVQLNKELSDEEVENLVAFMKSLTGEVPEVAMP